ncbi:hypothetical protein SeLEV6574_g04877 [Synchytrium endobioticum]|uniref:Uncharacterized protein n=1 Tax=Synchytrium endobioticum TaxID=286115 RepID=A0A507CXF6_9FUNG|nr:hypothetical protein SeLEV6574_g04877 [Synchytrium endobioticum]
MATVIESLRRQFVASESPTLSSHAETEDDEDGGGNPDDEIDDVSDDEYEEAPEPDPMRALLTVLPVLIPVISRMLGRHAMLYVLKRFYGLSWLSR